MTQKEYTLFDGTQSYIITPDEGKALKRTSDGLVSESEIWLGYTYYLNGEKLETPLLEKPEDYEEIDAPEKKEDGKKADVKRK